MMEDVEDTCRRNGVLLHEFKYQYEMMMKAARHLNNIMEMRCDRSGRGGTEVLQIYDIITKVIETVIGDGVDDETISEEERERRAVDNLCDIWSDKIMLCHDNKAELRKVVNAIFDMGVADGETNVENRVTRSFRDITDQALAEKSTTAKRRTCMEWVDWTIGRIRETVKSKSNDRL